jgi:hypothetical protein
MNGNSRGFLFISLLGKNTGYYPDTCWITNGSVAWPVTGYTAAYLNAQVIEAPSGWSVRERLPRRYRYLGPCGELRIKPVEEEGKCSVITALPVL